MKSLRVGLLTCALLAVEPAIAAPIVELRTNPACAQAFYRMVHALGHEVDVGRRLNPGNPRTIESCRNAHDVIGFAQLHDRLDAEMFAICHQDGSAQLTAEAARTARLKRTIIPRYCGG